MNQIRENTHQMFSSDPLLVEEGLALVRERDGWCLYNNPVEILRAFSLEEVMPVLTRMDEAITSGLRAVGFIAYEAASAFDPALETRLAGDGPLVWFGLYEESESLPDLGSVASHPVQSNTAMWSPALVYGTYQSSINRIKNYIAAGDTYQVNYTFMLNRPFNIDPLEWFTFLRPAPYSTFIHAGDHVICSSSPELFFELKGNRIVSKPMKGTAPRKPIPGDDEEEALRLQHSVKNRAENIMIVDMIRNDLGKIADTGSVRTRELFNIEKYETLYQMVSTVEARTRASLSSIFKALFPCASVTGAPKVRTMQIIKELETEPRGVYAGCIGVAGPGRNARFNVAIRTTQIDLTQGMATYGTGGGIVWDSSAEDEYRECATKAMHLRQDQQPFDLLETMLWTTGDGFVLLEEHMKRLEQSAKYFSTPVNTHGIISRLEQVSGGFDQPAYRIRLLAGPDGSIDIQPVPTDAGRFEIPVPEQFDSVPRTLVNLAEEPVDTEDVFLYHKTTRRALYEEARRNHPDAEDVVLWNQREEITESTIANLVALDGEDWITPPVRCGLLPGTYRGNLILDGFLKEKIIPRNAIRNYPHLFLINSVRGWMKIIWKH